MFREYIEKRISKLKCTKDKVKYLKKVIADSWHGMSFEFQSNAMGLREEALFQLKKYENKFTI